MNFKPGLVPQHSLSCNWHRDGMQTELLLCMSVTAYITRKTTALDHGMYVADYDSTSLCIPGDPKSIIYIDIWDFES